MLFCIQQWMRWTRPEEAGRARNGKDMDQKIRYFLKAAEENSFSKAAQQLYISPQALTKQITLLEAELGGNLFERSSRGIKLTQFGSYAFEKLGQLQERYDDTLADLKRRAKDARERINIGIFSALPRDSIVSPLVSFLLAFYPDYEISLNMVELAEGRRRLMDGKLDILLTNTHDQDDLFGYECLSFGEHPVKVVVGLEHPWALRDNITQEDMKQETFLKMTMDHDHYNVPDRELFYDHIPCRKIKEVDNFGTLLLLLRQAEGFAVFPLFFSNMEQEHMKGFDYPGEAIHYHTALIYHKENRLKGLAQIVHDLTEEFDLKRVERKTCRQL